MLVSVLLILKYLKLGVLSTKFKSSLVVSLRIVAIPQHRQNFRLDRSRYETTGQIILTWAGPSCDHEGKGSRSEAAHLHFEPADDLRLRYA